MPTATIVAAEAIRRGSILILTIVEFAYVCLLAHTHNPFRTADLDQSDVMQLFASCMEEEVSQSASRIEGTQPIALTEIVGRFFLLQHRPRYT